MTTKEMTYTLDKIKECVQVRSHNQCKKECQYCSCNMEPSNMLDAIERITNYIINTDKHSTRKSF